MRAAAAAAAAAHQTQYLTREDYVSRLEQYLDDLKAEIKAVEEELASLRQEA